MNSRRIIIKKVEEKRVNGRPLKEEVEFYPCWADILDLIGNELYNALSKGIENALIFRVRWCEKLEELRKYKDFKVYLDGVKYDIYYTDFGKEYKKNIYIKAKMVD